MKPCLHAVYRTTRMVNVGVSASNINPRAADSFDAACEKRRTARDDFDEAHRAPDMLPAERTGSRHCAKFHAAFHAKETVNAMRSP